MTKVAVVIPYYQREAGILRRAIASIYAQVLPRGVDVTVLVVDDQSPTPPEPEIAGFVRDGITVKVIARPNGGPAKARNTGLDAAANADVGADVVAFLDSDDSWMPRHLAVGLAAIDKGAELYFANNRYDGTSTWFDGLSCREALAAAATVDDAGLSWLSGERIMPLLLQECLAHTSTVIFDYRRHGTIRFDEDLALAGEDYLFWLSLASKAALTAFSTEPMASRGRGIDLYRGALDWDRPECIRRLFYALMLHKKMLERFCPTPVSKAAMAVKIDRLRRGIIYLLARNALAHRQTNAWVIHQLAREDGQFWLDLPRNAYVTISTKLRGNFDFPIG